MNLICLIKKKDDQKYLVRFSVSSDSVPYMFKKRMTLLNIALPIYKQHIGNSSNNSKSKFGLASHLNNGLFFHTWIYFSYFFFNLLFQVKYGQRDQISPIDAQQMNLLYKKQCEEGGDGGGAGAGGGGDGGEQKKCQLKLY